jgi:hypothetical protein
MRLLRRLYTVPLRLRSLFRRDQVEQDLEDEFRDHLERRIAADVARGLSAVAIQIPSSCFTRAPRSSSAGLVVRCRSGMDLLHGQAVRRRWLPNLDLQAGTGPQSLDPAVLLQARQP